MSTKPRLTGNFTKVPNKVFEMGLRPLEIAVLVYLWKNAPNFHPSLRAIAKILHVDKRSVSRTLKRLSELRIVKIDEAWKHFYHLSHPDEWHVGVLAPQVSTASTPTSVPPEPLIKENKEWEEDGLTTPPPEGAGVSRYRWEELCRRENAYIADLNSTSGIFRQVYGERFIEELQRIHFGSLELYQEFLTAKNGRGTNR